jgi:glycine C-acetyltransferase
MTCPAYGFTATLPPGQEMVTSTAIDVVRDQPELRQRLWDNQRYFVRRMADLNYKLVSTETPIVPIWLGDEAKAEQLARAVREEGIHVDAISFPGVPIKSARIRIQLNAGHRREEIDHLLKVLNLATATMAILPLAPVRFSTTTAWPHFCVRRSLMMRASASGAPPAAKPTMMRICFEG